MKKTLKDEIYKFKDETELFRKERNGNNEAVFVFFILSLFLGIYNLFADEQVYLLFYLVILIIYYISTIYPFIKMMGRGNKASLQVNVQLNILIIFAAFFYYFSTINEEVFSFEMTKLEVSYLSFSLSAFVLLFFNLTGKDQFIRGLTAKYLRIFFGALFVILPISYYIKMIAEYS